MSYFDPEQVEGKEFVPVLLRGGLDLVQSKYDVYAGSLQDVLNYESSDQGYTRSQGLLFYDGTYDAAVEDMWYIGTTYGVGGESTYTTAGGMTLGGTATWGTGNSGTVVYFNTTSGSPDYLELGLVEITGSVPAAGDTIMDSETGTLIALGGTLAYPPATISGARNPSTGAYLADTISKYLTYINDTVNTGITGQTSAAGSLTQHGKIPGRGGITGGFQFQDSVYGVRDFYGIGFDNGADEIAVGNSIVINVSSESSLVRGTCAEIISTAGAWTSGNAEGSIVIAPQHTASSAWVTSTAYALHDLVSSDGIEYVCKQAHTSAASDEPGTGASWTTYWDVNDIANFDNAVTGDDIMLAGSSSLVAETNTDNNQNKGGLWKATVNGWQAIDTGYSIYYEEGENAPSVRDAPLFVSNMLSVVKNSGEIGGTSASEVGAAPFQSWSNTSNVLASDNSRATVTLGSGQASNYIDVVVPTTAVPATGVRVIGVKINIEARQTGTGTPEDVLVALRNDATSPDWYLSENKAKYSELTGADAVVSYGGESDLWGLDTISADDIRNGDLNVRVQFKNTGASSGTANVDFIGITVYYVPQAEHVYFYDGTSDLAEADITAYQITNDGTFGGSTKAIGLMTLYNITDVTALRPGLTIRTGATGGGDEIATTSGNVSYNMLPSESEVASEDSMYNSIVANFYSDDGSEAVYAATGASPCFSYNKDYFSFIRTPLLQAVDKPRHVEFHVNTLALGYETGHVLLSSVGGPHDFSGISGGTSWGFKDPITGLQALPGETIGVFAKSSIGSITGADPQTLVQKHIQQTSGAQEYTMQHLSQPFFADFNGIANLSATERYGDFDPDRNSGVITPWLQDRLQERISTETQNTRPVAAVTVRNKRQYRLYFKDGYILTMSFFPDRAPEFTWQHYDTVSFGTDYVPTFLDSTVLSNGRERVVMGTADGSMYIVDGANGIQTSSGLTEMDAYIVTNPINLGRPESVAKYYHTGLQGQFFGHVNVQAWGDVNYTFDITSSAHDIIDIGNEDDPTVFEASNNVDTAYLPAIADGFSVKLQTSVNGSKPHTFQSLLFRASLADSDRNRTEKAY